MEEVRDDCLDLLSLLPERRREEPEPRGESREEEERNAETFRALLTERTGTMTLLAMKNLGG